MAIVRRKNEYEEKCVQKRTHERRELESLLMIGYIENQSEL